MRPPWRGKAALPLLEDKVVFFVGHVLDQLTARPDLINLISKNLSWGMLKQEASRPLTEADDFDLMTLFKITAKDSGIPEKKLEIMLYLIVEMVGSTCYSAILYQEPCDLEELKPHLFDTVSLHCPGSLCPRPPCPANPRTPPLAKPAPDEPEATI